MKRNIYGLLSIIMIVSMFLTACGATTPVVTQPADAPASGGEVVQAPTEKVEEVNTPSEQQPTAEPTKEVEVVDVPATDRKGGWLDKLIFSAIPEVDGAIPVIEAGQINMYAVAAENAAAFDKVRSNPELGYAMTYGSNNQLLLNTNTCDDTALLNPFTSAKIREAMNWAVDRNYVAQEIMNGMAQPKYTVLTGAFLDYSRYADLVAPLEVKYSYNLEKAKSVVDAEMVELGAEKDADGKWQYNGKPVVIIGVIRTEDKRKEIGNYFANQLEELGFTVDRLEKKRSEASPIWTAEPTLCGFHFYTAGWINQVVSRDDGNNFLQYNTGEVQGIPVMNGYKPSPELYAISQTLMNNDFATMEERRELFAQALELSMEESLWGVWVTDNISFSPYTKGVQSAYDLAGGFAPARLWPFTLRFEGQEGGEMRIAQSGILVQPWNPIAGSNFTDDGMIQQATQDDAFMIDPYTGLSLPQLIEKMEVVAQEGLPIQNSSNWVDLKFEANAIEVPGDAWADWDAEKQTFITVAEKNPEGVTAKTKTTLHYIPNLYDTKWHDGSNFSAADIVMNMIQTFDQAKPESKIYDESAVSSLETTLQALKGIKIVSTDPLVIEVYQNSYAMDAENTVNSAYDFTFYPVYTFGAGAWHNITPGILAEENKEIAFSKDKANELEVEWTSLIAGSTLDAQAKYLEQAASETFIPYEATLGQFITQEEAAARYENLQQFYADNKHLWIGTGPYYIDEVYPVEGNMVLSRFEDYIFPADRWSAFEEPMIAEAYLEGPLQVKVGEEAAFDVYIDFEDQPYPADKLEKVSYSLYNASNEVVAAGDAELVADGMYQVTLPADITAKLDAGTSKLVVAVASKVVSIPTFADYEFVVAK